jgi:hypothetical protein
MSVTVFVYASGRVNTPFIAANVLMYSIHSITLFPQVVPYTLLDHIDYKQLIISGWMI